MLDGMKFALGPTIAARRETLAAIGGFDAVKDYLAEDFVMGKLAAERGYGVIRPRRRRPNPAFATGWGQGSQVVGKGSLIGAAGKSGPPVMAGSIPGPRRSRATILPSGPMRKIAGIPSML